jgi:polar amino acid transport system substrate-binding protein
MKFSQVILVVVLSVVTSLATVTYLAPKLQNASPPVQQQPAKESAYDRVMRTSELRCGYAVYAPYFTKDPTTGAIGGIFHDEAEAIGEHLGLKVVWAAEVGLGDVSAALNSEKIDAFCGALWTAGKRVRVINFLKPASFEPLLVYVRADDHRFDNDISLINDPNVKVSTIDGEGGGLTGAEDFPKAKMVSLPQLASYADMFEQVITHKADVLFSGPLGADEFMKTHPGVLRPLLNHPLRIFPDDFAVKYGEDKLRDMLNQAQDDIIYSGKMEKILSHGEPSKGDFWRVAPAYVMPSQ